MAFAITYPNGFGGTVGDEWATAPGPVYTSGTAWYVSSITGSDAYDGRDRHKPLATVAQAHTNASAGDSIVFLQGHAQTLVGTQTISKAGLQLLGEGSGSTRPRFTDGVGGTMFSITGASVQMRNLYFPQSTVASGMRIGTGGGSTLFLLKDCYFECGANDSGSGASIGLGTDRPRITGCTFASTATSLTAQPDSAIITTNSINDLTMENCTVDGGTYGWSTYAVNLTCGGGVLTRANFFALDLLNDSDMYIVSGSSFRSYIRNRTGSSRVLFVP